MLKVAVLVSGGGTNLQAILDSVDDGVITNAEISLVVSNKPEAYALERAAKKNIPSAVLVPKDYRTRELFGEELIKASCDPSSQFCPGI